jgi:hypothetical protein
VFEVEKREDGSLLIWKVTDAPPQARSQFPRHGHLRWSAVVAAQAILGKRHVWGAVTSTKLVQ